jgi:hypothetical protein
MQISLYLNTVTFCLTEILWKTESTTIVEKLMGIECIGPL